MNESIHGLLIAPGFKIRESRVAMGSQPWKGSQPWYRSAREIIHFLMVWKWL